MTTWTDPSSVTFDLPSEDLYFDDSGTGSNLSAGSSFDSNSTLYFDDSGVGSDL